MPTEQEVIAELKKYSNVAGRDAYGGIKGSYNETELGIAASLGISPAQVYNAMQEGKLQYSKGVTTYNGQQIGNQEQISTLVGQYAGSFPGYAVNRTGKTSTAQSLPGISAQSQASIPQSSARFIPGTTPQENVFGMSTGSRIPTNGKESWSEYQSVPFRVSETRPKGNIIQMGNLIPVTPNEFESLKGTQEESFAVPLQSKTPYEAIQEGDIIGRMSAGVTRGTKNFDYGGLLPGYTSGEESAAAKAKFKAETVTSNIFGYQRESQLAANMFMDNPMAFEGQPGFTAKTEDDGSTTYGLGQAYFEGLPSFKKYSDMFDSKGLKGAKELGYSGLPDIGKRGRIMSQSKSVVVGLTRSAVDIAEYPPNMFTSFMTMGTGKNIKEINTNKLEVNFGKVPLIGKGIYNVRDANQDVYGNIGYWTGVTGAITVGGYQMVKSYKGLRKIEGFSRGEALSTVGGETLNALSPISAKGGVYYAPQKVGKKMQAKDDSFFDVKKIGKSRDSIIVTAEGKSSWTTQTKQDVLIMRPSLTGMKINQIKTSGTQKESVILGANTFRITPKEGSTGILGKGSRIINFEGIGVMTKGKYSIMEAPTYSRTTQKFVFKGESTLGNAGALRDVNVFRGEKMKPFTARNMKGFKARIISSEGVDEFKVIKSSLMRVSGGKVEYKTGLVSNRNEISQGLSQMKVKDVERISRVPSLDKKGNLFYNEIREGRAFGKGIPGRPIKIQSKSIGFDKLTIRGEPGTATLGESSSVSKVNGRTITMFSRTRGYFPEQGGLDVTYEKPTKAAKPSKRPQMKSDSEFMKQLNANLAKMNTNMNTNMQMNPQAATKTTSKSISKSANMLSNALSPTGKSVNVGKTRTIPKSNQMFGNANMFSQGTGLSSALLGLNVLKPTGILSPGTKTDTRYDYKTNNLFNTFTPQGMSQRSGMKESYLQVTIPSIRTPTTPGLGVPGMPSPNLRYPTLVPPPPISFPPLLFGDSEKPRRKGKRKLSRTPSYVAFELGWKTPKLSKQQKFMEETGLTYRPIIG